MDWKIQPSTKNQAASTKRANPRNQGLALCKVSTTLVSSEKPKMTRLIARMTIIMIMILRIAESL